MGHFDYPCTGGCGRQNVCSGPAMCCGRTECDEGWRKKHSIFHDSGDKDKWSFNASNAVSNVGRTDRDVEVNISEENGVNVKVTKPKK